MAEPYSGTVEHLLHELVRVDLMVQEAVRRFHAAQEQSPHEFPGLFVSAAEVEALLNGAAPVAPQFRPGPAAAGLPTLADTLQPVARAIAARAALTQAQGRRLRLADLAQRFQLSAFDSDVLLLALAPELDLKYERLYAYLQDDVTRKRPGVDLALNLLCPSAQAKLAARARFLPGAPLLAGGLLALDGDPAQPEPPLLARALRLDDRVVSYLCGLDEVDPRLAPHARVVRPAHRLGDLLLGAETARRLAFMAAAPPAPGLVCALQGPYGAGKQTVAEALCHEWGLALLVLDLDALPAEGAAPLAALLRLAAREAELQDAALYLAGCDGLLGSERGSERGGERGSGRDALLHAAAHATRPLFLAGTAFWEPGDALRDLPFARIELPPPAYADRLELWARALGPQAQQAADPDLPAAADPDLPADPDAPGPVDIAALANQFRLTGGQIHDAAASAQRLAARRAPGAPRPTQADLFAACRLQSARSLSKLARSITPHYGWQDIVLPDDRMEQLREVAAVVRHRALVFETWGFDGKLALGKGLNALFAGPSGTGKTMAADILAGELGLELYKIDLSNVVSKYIGETEKHLARIFAEARLSNAILFFDEADALFGKRSEVRDAHDRYANIEIAYLLQQMEEYDGMVVLATNLRKNMDDAFVRRMHFTVEFPFPGAGDRRRIWGNIWPEAAPRAPDLDLDFVAERFELAGGSIRNIALAAAFLAAAAGRPIGMAQLMRATRREYQKMGKVAVDGEFGYGTEAAWTAS